MYRREDVLKLTDELTAWADSKDKTELDTTALAAKREGLVAQLSAESKRMAMDLTAEFVRNNGARPGHSLVTLVTLVHLLTGCVVRAGSMLWMIMEAGS